MGDVACELSLVELTEPIVERWIEEAIGCWVLLEEPLVLVTFVAVGVE